MIYKILHILFKYNIFVSGVTHISIYRTCYIQSRLKNLEGGWTWGVLTNNVA